MNRNVMIVLGGAILAAVLVAVLIQVTIGGKKGAKVDEDKVQVLVAAYDLKIGKELVEGDIRWHEWPKSTLFSGAIIREGEQKPLEAIKGRLGRNLSKDEPVTKNILLKETKGNFVAASLKEGERAMAIKVAAESMVAGFISPGDYVDVILTYKQKMDIGQSDEDPRVQTMVDMNIKEYATETVLEHIRVLAVDQIAQKDDDDEKIKVGKTVTLAVMPRDGEKLALATKMGTVVLALRGMGDQTKLDRAQLTVTDARMTSLNDEILGEYKKIKEETGDEDDIGVKIESLKIMSGDQVSVVPVK